jgi:hypothetical protein
MLLPASGWPVAYQKITRIIGLGDERKSIVMATARVASAAARPEL